MSWSAGAAGRLLAPTAQAEGALPPSVRSALSLCHLSFLGIFPLVMDIIL